MILHVSAVADRTTLIAADAKDWEPPDLNRAGSAISVIIPAMNEAANIGWVLSHLPEGIDQVVLVDGRSVDGTIEVARSVRPDIEIVHEDERGKGAALRAGFAAARGRYVVMLDADGSMDPMEIPRFVQRLDEGWEVVKGSRFLPTGGSSDISHFRSLGNRGLLMIAQLLFGFRQSDLCYGYIAFQRAVLPRLSLTATGFEIEAQIAVRSHLLGLRVTEVPSFEAARRNGCSNLNPMRDGMRVLRSVFADRFRPRRANIRRASLLGAEAFPHPEGVLADAFDAVRQMGGQW